MLMFPGAFLSAGRHYRHCKQPFLPDSAGAEKTSTRSLPMLTLRHAIPRDDVLLGIVRAERIETVRHPEDFDVRLGQVVAERAGPLNETEEARRIAARDILRNGSYKPTGRGKPASDYLLRRCIATGVCISRINAPVDICNYLSLRYVVPISLWDLDRAASDRYVFSAWPGRGRVRVQSCRAADRCEGPALRVLRCGQRSDTISSDGNPLSIPFGTAWLQRRPPKRVGSPPVCMLRLRQCPGRRCRSCARSSLLCCRHAERMAETACGVVLPQAVADV